MSNAKRTVDVRKVRRTEGEDDPVVTYEGAIVLDTPAEGAPVTLADVQQLLLDSIADEGIPASATVTQGTELRLRWTDADLP